MVDLITFTIKLFLVIAAILAAGAVIFTPQKVYNFLVYLKQCFNVIVSLLLLIAIPIIGVYLLGEFLNPAGFWESLVFIIISAVAAIILFIITAFILALTCKT